MQIVFRVPGFFVGEDHAAVQRINMPFHAVDRQVMVDEETALIDIHMIICRNDRLTVRIPDIKNFRGDLERVLFRTDTAFALGVDRDSSSGVDVIVILVFRVAVKD